MKSCEEYDQFIADYIEGSLSEKQRLELEYHLDRCEACVRYIQDYKKTIDVSQAAFQGLDSVKDEMPEALIKAILEASKKAS